MIRLPKDLGIELYSSQDGKTCIYFKDDVATRYDYKKFLFISYYNVTTLSVDDFIDKYYSDISEYLDMKSFEYARANWAIQDIDGFDGAETIIADSNYDYVIEHELPNMVNDLLGNPVHIPYKNVEPMDYQLPF